MQRICLKPVKVVVWDLDNTLWKGVLLEGDAAEISADLRAVIEGLDARGVLQSIASRNEADLAAEALKRQGVDHFFLHPEIGWGAKSEAVKQIAAAFNLGLDAFLFVDDDAFERAEVAAALLDVDVIDASDAPTLLQHPRLVMLPATAEAARRRQMYVEDAVRSESERSFDSSPEAFMASLELAGELRPAKAVDLERTHELTVRTNQLNSTGRPYSKAELEALMRSPLHQVLTLSLRDRFGDYGQVGLVLLETTPTAWTIKLLLISCRVMSRGAGGAVIAFLLSEARRSEVSVLADFRATGRNRQMLVTYRFAGFQIAECNGEDMLLAHDSKTLPEVPTWICGRLQ